ncbi:hypothetical protein [Paenibacillus dendritiformis]|uniref:hypothetical protein n=1 Tax=Paenibacillus dendritiformis TaxID=130049 RepID=UPI00140D47A0|nr:hypothetical protein [Paenibacillus dendritiformis]
MTSDSKEMMDAFEKLSEAGNGVLAIPPQNKVELKTRDRIMQEYLRRRSSDKVIAQRK